MSKFSKHLRARLEYTQVEVILFPLFRDGFLVLNVKNATLGYFAITSVTKKKSFTTLIRAVNAINLSFFISDAHAK
jgi:hypothetical protein